MPRIEGVLPWRWVTARAKTSAKFVLRGAYVMYLLARDRRTPWLVRGAAVISLGYVASPFQLLPDYLPVIGFFDDAAVLALGLFVARLLVPSHVMAEHRASAERVFPGDPQGRGPKLPSPLGDEFSRPPLAFGVDPARRQFYSLRQSRYDALAEDISDWAGAAGCEKLRLLVIGCGVAAELRHLAAKPHFEKLAVSGANLDGAKIYQREAYEEVFVGDLVGGYPEIRSNAYDVVVCEQVLEHLDEIDLAIATLGRVLKPGGRAIVGVPIFPPPLHLIRKHVVPKIDALLSRRQSRGHRQAFSLFSFLSAMKTHSGLRVVKVRGFRVISGGLLQSLDNYRWWWRLNRRVGEVIPAFCIEVQAIMEKPRHDREREERNCGTPPGCDFNILRKEPLQ